jgi:RNA polymerase sigma-70 factor (ECF subfamily)
VVIFISIKPNRTPARIPIRKRSLIAVREYEENSGTDDFFKNYPGWGVLLTAGVERLDSLCSYTRMARSDRGPKHDGPSDEALVSASLQGDRSAYRTLVERYQDRLFRVAFDIVKNQHDAEDIAQESFVKAFLSLDKFKGQSSFFTWLYRITFNMAVDFQRRNQRRGGQHFEYKEHLGVSRGEQTTSELSFGGDSSVAQNIEGPQEALVRKQTGARLNAAFAQLSDEHRAVIILREVDGLDYEEIANALGIPRGTVMSRLFYARKMLQKALQDLTPESAGMPGRDRTTVEPEPNHSSLTKDDELPLRLKRAPE